MKKIIMCLFMVVSSVLTAFADNTLTLSTNDGSPGDVIKVTASLTTTDDIVAGEIHIPLNEQMEYMEGSFAYNSERVSGHAFSASVDANNVLNVFFYSMDGSALPATTGELFSFSIKLGTEPGSYTLTPTAMMSDAAGSEVTTTASGTTFKILAPKLEFASSAIDFGSVAIRSSYTRTLTVKNTGTTQLDVTGVEFSSDRFISSETDFSIAAGGSKSLTITYSPVIRGSISETATFTSNAVNGSPKATITASPYSVNTLSVVGASGISGTEVTIGLNMSNMEPITGVQCSFALPTGLEYVENSFATSDRSTNLTGSASVSNGVLTVYLYSMDNTAIEEGSGSIGTFRLLLNAKSGTYTLSPKDVVLSNVSMENMVSSTSSGSVTIQSPTISCNSSLDMGTSSLTETASKTFAVKNSGKASMTISRVTFLAEGYSISEAFPITVAAGSSANITVNYKGSSAGSYSTTMNIYTNDPATPMKSVSVSGTLFEPNYLAVSSILSADRKTCKVTFSLDNYSDIVAVQLNVHGLTGMTTSTSNLKMAERCSNLSSSVSSIGDGEYMVFLYSFSNAAITGSTGEIFTLTFNSDEAVNASDLNVTVDNIILSNSNSINMSSSSSISCKTILLGDVNGDNLVNIADVACLISYLNGVKPSNFVEAAADVNTSGTIDINDVTALSNALLGK